MKRSGFTLIELLLVIAIIAMLIGISVPVLLRARQQAEATICCSNLRRTALALAVYEQQNDTFPCGLDDVVPLPAPPPGGYVGYPMYDRMGWWWFHFLADGGLLGWNLGRGTTLWCPSRRIQDPFPEENVLWANYGVNQAICKDAQGQDSEFVGVPLGQDRISRPARTLLITDSGYSLINWYHATNTPPQSAGKTRQDASYVPGLWINKERFIWPGHERDAINGRHAKKTVNVGFADGSVSRLKADDLLAECADSSQDNCFPLWLPNQTRQTKNQPY